MDRWKDVVRRTWNATSHHHIGLVAAGIAFYGLLALFPAMTALVALTGLVLDPAFVADEIERFSGLLPNKAAAEIVLAQALDVARSGRTNLSIAALVGVLIALYSASKGVSSIIEGLNIAYEADENRSFVQLSLTRLALTAAMIVGLALGLASTLIIPSLLSLFPVEATTGVLVTWARWGVLLAFTLVGIGLLYNFGPDRDGVSWRWISPGALVACFGWIAASVGLSFYVENFASYNESFGTLAGVILLLLWFWISAYVLLLGAEINGALESRRRQTADNST